MDANQTFEASYREQLRNAHGSEILEKPNFSNLDATKGDLSLNWFLLNFFLKN